MSGTKESKNRNTKIQDLVYMAIGAVIITVCSWISIPAAVPFTLQTFAVFLVVSLLGGKRGTVSIIVYILLGAVGVPVFSGMTGGFIKLIGVTGGYIIGFIFVGLIYWLAQTLYRYARNNDQKLPAAKEPEELPEKSTGTCISEGQQTRYRNKTRRAITVRIFINIAALLAGLLICYAFGTAWFMVAYAQGSEAVGLGTALGMCVVPFIIPDLIKMAVAIILADRLRRPLHLNT